MCAPDIRRTRFLLNALQLLIVHEPSIKLELVECANIRSRGIIGLADFYVRNSRYQASKRHYRDINTGLNSPHSTHNVEERKFNAFKRNNVVSENTRAISSAYNIQCISILDQFQR